MKLGTQEAGRVELTIAGETEDSKVVAYLISLDDREITVTFIMPESRYIANKKEIEKIVNSIKYELN